ncbi:sporulation domain-containing protein [Steroidobacter denitrificans]|uniref:Sporulation domain-containing protein n=1 Tax=Steroidobacter denitrificans TaxID=465721 RepID=A0A127F8I7_STEDE|nr:SPOR domain-containing protein [Steroidobacter denitrificans]AMN45918.1 sporulation domain-containing protein [Steroidobacter denitrificans]
MRTLCLLLILANALYFIWSQVLDVPVGGLERGPGTRAVPPPRIVLAREAMADSAAGISEADGRSEIRPEVRDAAGGESEQQVSETVRAPVVQPPGGPSSSPPERLGRHDTPACTTIGPFADLPQASQAQAALRSAGFHPRQRLEEGDLWVGYWVSIQGFSDRKAAESALEILTANAVTDVYIMPGSDTAVSNALSLGVFSDYQRARRRVEEIRALGLEPRIEDRRRGGTVYWLDVDLSGPDQRIDSSIFQTDPGKITRLEMAACPPGGE